jgi:ATP-dependent Clp protease ATP-binding subunit ClpC
LFLGPTGVGKTLLAKSLAKFLFGEEDSLIQIDMSEFMEKHNVSKLVGAPPGYVGYEEGGQLTEKIRRRPYAVVLLDEVEKAHSDVFNMLLQVMEEGHVTDSFGRVIDFRNVVLIMTSNIGADLIKNQSALGFRNTGEGRDADQKRKEVMDEVEKFFRPEFLNRIDDPIFFLPLDKKDLEEIIKIEMAQVLGRLRERGIELEVTEEATEFLIEKGYNPDFGARPLRRSIQQHVEDTLAEKLLRGDFPEGSHIRMEVIEGEVHFQAVPTDSPKQEDAPTTAP